MSVTVDQLGFACFEFFKRSRDSQFLKSSRIPEWGEREGILPALKWFLLGAFGEQVHPEARIFKGSRKRVDFMVGNVAVEVAVRRRGSNRGAINKGVNSSELWKLLKHPGSAALILLDYSSDPLKPSDLEGYRDWPSLGKGNHKISPFSVLYFYSASRDECEWIRKNIKVD